MQICDDLVNHDEENTQVQNAVAQFRVYESIVVHVFPIIGSFFLGSWSDTFGRKFLLYFYFVMKVWECGMYLLNAYFMSWPKEYILFSVYLPVAMSGGHVAFSMGIAAFITDISSPEMRTARLSTVWFIESLGSPLGTKIGAILYEKGS